MDHDDPNLDADLVPGEPEKPLDGDKPKPLYPEKPWPPYGRARRSWAQDEMDRAILQIAVYTIILITGVMIGVILTLNLRGY